MGLIDNQISFIVCELDVIVTSKILSQVTKGTLRRSQILKRESYDSLT